MNKVTIKQTNPGDGRDTKVFRAYGSNDNAGRADCPLGVTASCTSDPASIGARHCAAKAFIKLVEPKADRDEIETRIALKGIARGIWEATLQPPLAGASSATMRCNDWKSVKAQMPDADQTVMVYAPKADEPVWLGFFDGEIWRDVSAAPYEPSEVTHWMDLPNPPEVAS